ncbi:MAG: serine hydrolase [Patescibacteria group bacterium]
MKKFFKVIVTAITVIIVIAFYYLIYDRTEQLQQYKKAILGIKDDYARLKQQYGSYKEQTKNLRQLVILAKDPDSKNIEIAGIIYDYANKVNGDLSIYYKNLTTNESIVVDGDRKYYMASLYKVILTIFILDEIKNGKITLDAKIGTSSATLETGLSKIITESNNEYAQLLAKKYGWKETEEAMKRKLGIDFTFNENLEINIKNVGLLFENIALTIKLTDSQSSYLLNLLKNQKKISKLPKYLPSNIYSHNKTGELEEYSHDAGIFYTPKANYILVFMSKTQNPSATNEQMAQMSKAIYELLNETKMQ